jgi:hypothetical protein
VGWKLPQCGQGTLPEYQQASSLSVKQPGEPISERENVQSPTPKVVNS